MEGENNMNALDERIKELRKASGLTQLQLAERLNVTDKAVSKWEVGEANPDIALLPIIAGIFGVTLDYLLTGKKEEEKISLDDMDNEKRISYLIKKDDADSFIKYDYLRKSNSGSREKTVFCGNVRFGQEVLTTLNKELWLELFENKAQKIINKCFDKFVEYNDKGISAAVLVVDFINDFVRSAVELDRDDVLKCIGARHFSIGDAYSSRYSDNKIPSIEYRKTYCLPLVFEENYLNFITELVRFGISRELLCEILSRKESSPRCFEYMTSTKYSVNSKELNKNHNKYGWDKQFYIFTDFDSEMISILIKLGDFDKVEKLVSVFEEELSNICLDVRDESIEKTFAVHYHTVHGRIMPFSKNQINLCVKAGKEEIAKKMANYNIAIIDKYTKTNKSFGSLVKDIPVVKENDIKREISLLRNDLPEEDKLLLRCVNDHIINVWELSNINDLEFVRKVLDNNAYHYYEFVYDCLKGNKQKVLFEFFVDNEMERLADLLLMGEDNYPLVLSEAYSVFVRDPRFDKTSKEFNKNIGLLRRQNLIQFEELTCEERTEYHEYHECDINGNEIVTRRLCDKYLFQEKFRKEYGGPGGYADKLENNQVINHIKELKENIYQTVKNRLDAKKKAKEELAERTKAVKGLTREYFDKLLETKQIEMVYLKLCSLLDVVFKYDYHYEGEDFKARMDKHFSALETAAPKSRDCDDGWGYMVLDTQYENDVVKPAASRIRHLENLLSRLRMQRNNIAHSETNPVEELSLDELKECLDYVFSISKGAK